MKLIYQKRIDLGTHYGASHMTSGKGKIFWGVQIPGWILLMYLIYAQGIAAFDYDLGVSMGTQDSAETITEVGTAFFYGFALSDLLIYIPLLLFGLVGHLLGQIWGKALLCAALGITIYWPVVCLSALVAARGAPGWHIINEVPYWVVLPAIALWGAWALFAVIREPTRFD